MAVRWERWSGNKRSRVTPMFTYIRTGGRMDGCKDRRACVKADECIVSTCTRLCRLGLGSDIDRPVVAPAGEVTRPCPIGFV